MTDTVAVIADYPRLRQAQPLTPFAAGLHRMAAFMTERRLPEGDVAFMRDQGVIVDLTGLPHVRGAVKQWATALGSTFTMRPEVHDGRLYTYFDLRGRTPDLTFVHVVARQLVETAGA